MVFLILVSHEDPVKSTLGFHVHVAINHPEGKLIIYTAFYLKIQVKMDKAKSIKPCKNPGMIVHTCSTKNSNRMQTEFIYDI